jgi:hypothetical protein
MSPLLLGGGVQLAESATALEVTAPGGVLFNAGAADVWEIKATGELAGVGTPRYIQNVKTPSGVSDATPKAYVDGVAGSAFVWGNSSTPGTATQVVLDPGYEDRVAPAAAAAHPQLRMPFTGVITNLYIQCGTGADATVDVTVYVGASPTSITVAMGAGVTQGADTTHTAAVTAGDKVTVQCKGAGGITTGFVDIVATDFVKRA